MARDATVARSVDTALRSSRLAAALRRLATLVALAAAVVATVAPVRAAPDDPVVARRDMDASLAEILTAAGVKSPLRTKLQRPVDPRLAALRKDGGAGAGLFRGKARVAKNAYEVEALSGKLEPGEQLVLAAGTWDDARFTFEGKGTAFAPILVRPEKPGAVVFGRFSEVTFVGEHLVVSDLEFRDRPYAWDFKTSLRLGIDDAKPADRCIVHRVRISGAAAPGGLNDFADFLQVHGQDVTVADCVFERHHAFGSMVRARATTAKAPARIHVLDNRFVGRKRFDGLSYAATPVLEIGNSMDPAASAGALVQGNEFVDCAGDDDVVSVECSDVVLRRNRFVRCDGTVGLIKADRVLVQQNVFEGGTVEDAGGLLVAGSDHVVVENTFRDLRGSERRGAVVLTAADGPSHTAVITDRTPCRNVLIARNRFERTRTRIAVGFGASAERSLLPAGLRVLDNVFTGAKETSPFDFIAPDASGEMRKSIVESGNRFEP